MVAWKSPPHFYYFSCLLAELSEWIMYIAAFFFMCDPLSFPLCRLVGKFPLEIPSSPRIPLKRFDSFR